MLTDFGCNRRNLNDFMVLCMYIPLHIQTFLKMKCLVVRCAIPIPQRIWFKGEVGGFVLFNFAENCPAHPSSAISQFSVGGENLTSGHINMIA